MSKKIASHELYGREKNIPILFNNLAELALQNNDPHQAVIYCDLAQHFAHQMNDLYNQLLATINRSLAAAILTQQADSHLATNLTILQVISCNLPIPKNARMNNSNALKNWIKSNRKWVRIFCQILRDQ